MNSRRKKKGPGAGLVILLILLIAILAALAAAAFYFWRLYGMTNYVRDNEVIMADASLLTESTGLTDAELEEIRAAAAATDNITLPDNKDVYNVLLIGVDRRDASWNGNSDSMIIFSINKKNRSLHMTSMMRDLYADIPGIGVRKLNNAYAVGGGPLLVETIEKNYKVNIDNYAAVDFIAMSKIIDALGGITLTVTDDEARLADGLIMDMCQLQNISYEGHLFGGGAGTYECDGLMTVGYSRIRYTGNSDYERTERQRMVMGRLMEKVRAMSAGELNAFVTKILPYVTHNIPSTTILSLLMQAPSMMNYSVGESRVPYDGMYTTRGEILVPDMELTVAKLHEDIYN